jgi:hypothetical protein
MADSTLRRRPSVLQGTSEQKPEWLALISAGINATHWRKEAYSLRY